MDARIEFELTDARVREACMHHFFWRCDIWLRLFVVGPVIAGLLVMWGGWTLEAGLFVFIVFCVLTPVVALVGCPDMWLFVLRPGQFHILPTVALDRDLAAFILAHVRDHGGKTD